MGDSHFAYARSQFRTRLPLDRTYTESHFWLEPAEEQSLRVGFSRFATRMLGEVVEFDFEIKPGERIRKGQAIGWFEGFKAVTELYAPLEGIFLGENPDLAESVGQIHRAPYAHWLYAVRGAPPEDAHDASGYAAFLDGTIDRMMGPKGT